MEVNTILSLFSRSNSCLTRDCVALSSGVGITVAVAARWFQCVDSDVYEIPFNASLRMEMRHVL